MACEEWRERLVTYLYGESELDEVGSVEAHLGHCPGCRESLAELGDARRALRESAPDVPGPRPLVVLAPSSSSGRRASRVAAGLAAVAAVLAVGVAIGIAIAPERTSDDPGIGAAELRAALDAQERRIDRRIDARLVNAASAEEPAGSTGSTVTVEDLDRAVRTIRDAVDRGRREDVEFLMAEIAAAEMRSGAALDATRETLRYYALAENPGATEW